MSIKGIIARILLGLKKCISDFGVRGMQTHNGQSSLNHQEWWW